MFMKDPGFGAPLSAGCGGGARPLRSVLSITTDTTRADALGCFGGGAEAPAIDRLERAGIRREEPTPSRR